MQSLYDISAPAKLNLFLHITGRRGDGYHLLQSVFMLIDWCDTLHFSLRNDGRISREDLRDALPAEDLCVRAAKALQQAVSNCTLGAHIGIEKNIPAQAGMGGGSSDAASTLLALNRLWNLNLPLATLKEIGLRLGADVPFFLSGGHAWVEGIGERISPVALPKSQWLVVKPEQGLETKLIFSDSGLKRDTNAAIISGFAANAFESNGLQFGANDLQPVAQTLCSGIGDALDWLASQGLNGRMTGSGSAVFAQVLQAATWNVQTLPIGCVARLCSSLDAHPLAGWADSDGFAVGSLGC
jgi:4-diphosphocytidyl-2-C-methyl-D-erythritol kinase